MLLEIRPSFRSCLSNTDYILARGDYQSGDIPVRFTLSRTHSARWKHHSVLKLFTIGVDETFPQYNFRHRWLSWSLHNLIHLYGSLSPIRMSLLNKYPCVNITAPGYLSFSTVSFTILSAAVATGGNLLVVLAVFLDPNKNLRSPSNYFVASLGFADLLVGLLACPMSAVYPITEGLKQTNSLYRVWMHMIYFVTCTASLLSLTALALDRYVAIAYPLVYRTKLSPLRAFLVSVLLWTASVLVSQIYLIVGDNKFRFVFANTAIAVTFAVLTFTNVKICKYLRCQIHTWSNWLNNTRGNLVMKQALQRERKTTKTLFVALGLFLACYLPSCVCIYIINFCSTCECLFIIWARNIQWMLVLANSSVNPFVYAWKLRNFRKAFKSILTCRACGRRQRSISAKLPLTSRFITNFLSNNHVLREIQSMR